MSGAPDPSTGELADVLRALLADAAPELFGGAQPAVALAVLAESLAFPVGQGAEPSQPVEASPSAGDGRPGALEPDLLDAGTAAADQVRQRLTGRGEAVVSLAGTAARVRRARDLTLALLVTDADRVAAAVRGRTDEGGYSTSHRLTDLAVAAVETLPAQDAATVKVSLRFTAVLELAGPRDGAERRATQRTTTTEATS